MPCLLFDTTTKVSQYYPAVSLLYKHILVFGNGEHLFHFVIHLFMFEHSSHHVCNQTVRLSSNHNNVNEVYLGLLSYNTQKRLQAFRISTLDPSVSLRGDRFVEVIMPQKSNDFAFSSRSSTRGGK